MLTRTLLPLCLVLLAASALAVRARQETAATLFEGQVHLGDDATPEWTEASAEPQGDRLEFEFAGRANAGEQLLIISQRNINNVWNVFVNETLIATLDVAEELADHYYTLPAGVLRDGDNAFAIRAETPSDDITVGNVRLVPQSFREYFNLRPVTVSVTDSDSGLPSPARITVTDAADEVVELFYGESLQTAVRRGVIYTSNGVASFELPVGEYRLYATRGSEWGLGTGALSIGETGENSAALSFRREVDTTGFIAADTHIHTLTFSGHGDSSVEERMVTLAAEGVELAVATDHNHNTDYRPYQERMELTEFFTPVVGNEVTTPIGHYNAFPLDPEAEVPPYELHDPYELVDGMRAKGAKVIILNHPRWPDHERGPYGAIGLDPFTGESSIAGRFTFDAMELINSDTEEHQPFVLFDDWFALLNRGETIRIVGSSDSHTVGHPVGQGRTYIASSSDDPAQLNLDELCANIVAGRSSVGLGIFCDVTINGLGMGALVLATDGKLDVKLRVASPSWVQPEQAIVFVNGVRTREVSLDTRPGVPTNVNLALQVQLDSPGDAYVVCAVTGAHMQGPYWVTTNAYTLAATNPVFIDRDGDGAYSSPRATAQAHFERTGLNPSGLQAVLREAQASVAIQLLHLVRMAYLADAEKRVLQVGGDAARTQERVQAFLESLSTR